jgi:hypothetical protein
MHDILKYITDTAQIAPITNTKRKFFITADKISIIQSKTNIYIQDGLSKSCSGSASF